VNRRSFDIIMGDIAPGVVISVGYGMIMILHMIPYRTLRGL